MPSESKITFYGEIHEIGGNKFLLQDKGTRILYFGMQMGKFGDYFAEFVNPRTYNGMGDLFGFGLLPKLKGFYRRDYVKHTNFDGNEDNEIHVIVLTHEDYIIFEEYPINFILKLIKLFSEERG